MSQDMMYGTVSMEVAPCDTMFDSDQHSLYISSVAVILCCHPMAVKHQQERVHKINFTLCKYYDVSLILGACGNQVFTSSTSIG